jgi:transcriptional regulator with XRE-family HTH domain
MVLLRQLLGDVLRRLRLRQGRTLREVSASARVSLGYLSEVERGQKEASSELLAAICGALNTPLSQVFREVSDNFALAELQNEPILNIPREPSLRVPEGVKVGRDDDHGYVPISAIVPDEDTELEFVDGEPGFTDMVSVLVPRGWSHPAALLRLALLLSPAVAACSQFRRLPGPWITLSPAAGSLRPRRWGYP